MVGPLCFCYLVHVRIGGAVCNGWSTLLFCCLMRVGMGGVVCNGFSTAFVLSDAGKNGRCCV